MFSGSIAGWLGWSISGPLVWTGAIVAGIVCCYRRRGSLWPPFVLACSVAFAIFGGFPENYALMAITLGVGLGAAAMGRGRLDTETARRSRQRRQPVCGAAGLPVRALALRLDRPLDRAWRAHVLGTHTEADELRRPAPEPCAVIEQPDDPRHFQFGNGS